MNLLLNITFSFFSLENTDLHAPAIAALHFPLSTGRLRLRPCWPFNNRLHLQKPLHYRQMRGVMVVLAARLKIPALIPSIWQSGNINRWDINNLWFAVKVSSPLCCMDVSSGSLLHSLSKTKLHLLESLVQCKNCWWRYVCQGMPPLISTPTSTPARWEAKERWLRFWLKLWICKWKNPHFLQNIKPGFDTLQA